MFSPQFSSMCLPTSTPSFITSLPILQSAHPRNFLSNPNLSSLKRFHPSSSSSSSPKTPFSFQMTMPQQPHINVSSDVPSSVATLVLQKSAEALSKTGKFTVALSGGSLPKILAQALPSSVDISKWRVFLADERIVPLDDADSNYRQIQSQIPGLSVIPIDPTLSPRECALNYQRLVTEALGEKPVFDAVLLGLGPDGHTCSLFPGHPLLHVNDRVIAHLQDSPKPPPQRVTLTLPVLNDATSVIFVCTGAGKAPVVKDILENRESKLPGALVRPKSGNCYWFLDEAAASELSSSLKQD